MIRKVIMRNHAWRYVLAVIASAGMATACIIAAPVAHASLSPTYHIMNVNGGCLKDPDPVDSGLPYEVANCAVSSNFTRSDGHNEGGVEFYEYTDGSGLAVTAAGDYFVNGQPVGANTQLLDDPVNGIMT